jgi:hypothetical protein
MEIKVTYVSCDGVRKRKTFKTLGGAQKWAQDWIGKAPSLGSGYAVSDDGVGTIYVSGATLTEVFPSSF